MAVSVFFVNFRDRTLELFRNSFRPRYDEVRLRVICIAGMAFGEDAMNDVAIRNYTGERRGAGCEFRRETASKAWAEGGLEARRPRRAWKMPFSDSGQPEQPCLTMQL